MLTLWRVWLCAQARHGDLFQQCPVWIGCAQFSYSACPNDAIDERVLEASTLTALNRIRAEQDPLLDQLDSLRNGKIGYSRISDTWKTRCRLSTWDAKRLA